MSADPWTSPARTPNMRVLSVLFVLSCHRSNTTKGNLTDTDRGALLLRGAVVLGQGEVSQEGTVQDILVRDGRIAAIGPEGTLEEGADAEVVDLAGHWVSPAFIDSHVHFAYRRELEGMADGGVAGAVDMAAPVELFNASTAPLVVKISGPMVTAVGGYPTQSWGSNGYGLECADADAARTAVGTLAGLGAALIKLPVTSSPVLEDDALAAAVEAAHGLGLKVASHALEDASALRAGTAGADVLAHTPTGRLSEETLALWTGDAVVSTLRAFGGSDTTVDNLRALRAGGATVLYGTDFGNTRTAGVDPDEIALLEEAGLDGAAILAAGTSTPAAYWGFEDLGVLRAGARASLMVLDADPRQSPATLAAPSSVYIDGVRR